ncbi:hypothetical protein [Hyphococcus sp.]|uniref:hypothetical protein n=1 Tax=Hyphococcus sp. TaxID=2038636 RepID=UPI003D0BB080
MKKLLGAVSISALMLAGAACGNSDNAYETAETDAVEEDADRTAYADKEDGYGTDADRFETADAADNTESWNEERYDSSADAVMSDTTDPTLRTATQTLTRTRSEIEALAARAFEGADANNDGALQRDEYVQLALASARDFDAFVTEPVNLMSVNPVDDPVTVGDAEEGTAAADVINDDDDVAAGDDMTRMAETAGATQTAMQLNEPLGAEKEAEIESSAAQLFQQAAGGDAEVTEAELREAFLARFEQADEDGDDELDASELRKFAALTRGEDQASTMNIDE